MIKPDDFSPEFLGLARAVALAAHQDRWWLAPCQETEDCIASKRTGGALQSIHGPFLGVLGDGIHFLQSTGLYRVSIAC